MIIIAERFAFNIAPIVDRILIQGILSSRAPRRDRGTGYILQTVALDPPANEVFFMKKNAYLLTLVVPD